MTKAKLVTLTAVMVMLLALPAMVLAQAQPPRPAVFGGSATLDGITASNGTIVTAIIDGAIAATNTVTGGNYALLISQPPSASYAGKEITFKVGSGTAAETATWTADGGGELNLTATSGPPPAAATPIPPSAPVVSEPGPKGDKGDKGDPGVPGPAGAKGDTGAAGSAGAAGAAGVKGDKGDAGSAGAAGAAGPAGAAGAGGPAGAAGADGEAAATSGGLLGIIGLIVAVVALIAAGGAIVMGGSRR